MIIDGGKNMDLREVLRIFLDQNDLTAAFVARKIGISASSLCRWMKYERELPTEVLIKLKNFMSGDFLIGIKEIIGE